MSQFKKIMAKLKEKKAERKEKRHKERRHKDRVFESSEGMPEFKARLAALRPALCVKEQEGDGNCLFRSISDQLCGDSSQYARIRSEVIEHMEKHREWFSLYIEDDEDHDEYFSRMGTPGEWGGNLELVAAAEKYQVKVIVFQTGGPTYTITPTIRDGAQSGGKKKFRETQAARLVRSIAVSYHGECHYNSIRRADDPDKHCSPAMELEPVQTHTHTHAQTATADRSGCDETDVDDGDSDGDRNQDEDQVNCANQNNQTPLSLSSEGNSDQNPTPATIQPVSSRSDAKAEARQAKAAERAAKELSKMKARAARVLMLAHAQAQSQAKAMSKKDLRKAQAQAQAQTQTQTQGQIEPVNNAAAQEIVAGVSAIAI